MSCGSHDVKISKSIRGKTEVVPLLFFIESLLQQYYLFLVMPIYFEREGGREVTCKTHPNP